jgi:RNA-directed DNA polymerase
MTKKPLQELFEAMYHGKPDFQDFLTSAVADNYSIGTEGEGGRRLLKPSAALKEYHRFLNLFIFEFLPVNVDVAFAYRKGVGAIDAVQKHRNSKYFFQTDIIDFFGSIDSSLAKRVLIEGAESLPVSDVLDHIDRIIQLVCVDGFLPVGFPASAPLSNCVLYDFDNALDNFCNGNGLVYSRYADDIILSGADLEAISGVEKVIQETLDRHASSALKLNAAKTRHFRVGGKLKILGLMILPNSKITPDTKKRREVEVLLFYYLRDLEKFRSMVEKIKPRILEKKDLSLEDYVDFLSGSLNYVDSIDPDYTDKLRKKFGSATIDVLIHKGYAQKK